MPSRLRRSILGLALASPLGACQPWRTADLTRPGPRALADGRPVRVTRPDGRRVTLVRVRAAGDSLVGDSSGVRTAVALADVRLMEVRTLDDRRSGPVWLGIAVVAGLAALLGSFFYLATNTT